MDYRALKQPKLQEIVKEEVGVSIRLSRLLFGGVFPRRLLLRVSLGKPTFVPDQKGYKFIVNLCGGRVLDVLDSSLKNYAPVNQYPFNGTDSQRWQLLSC